MVEGGVATGVPQEDPLAELFPAENITFEIPVPVEQGGGKLIGSAGTVEVLGENYVSASGGVDLRYQAIRIQAQRAAVDLSTGIVTAEGEVILDEGPQRLVGSTMTFNLETKTGELSNANAYVDPDFYFSGETIRKVGEDTYTVHKGVFTSCTKKTPQWSFKLSNAKVTVDGYARATNARMKIKKLPVLYTPYLLWPVKADRTSGLLAPRLGTSEQRGTSLGLAYFQTLGRSWDTTFYADFYTEDYLGIGNELRYRPNESTTGLFEGYAIDDPEADEVRWKASWSHVADSLPFGMRGVASFTDYSDFEFFRDFERDLRNINLRAIHSYAFVAGNWGSHSLNILVDDRDTFLRRGSTVKQKQLPEIEYKLRPTRIAGSNLFFEVFTSGNYFSTQRGEADESRYGRTHLAPKLTYPLSIAPWLSVSLTAGGTYTWYEDSLDAEEGKVFSGESLSRFFGNASAEIIGPSFSRIFEGFGNTDKFKHIIEPRWALVHIDQFDEQFRVPIFDELDRIERRDLLCGLATGCQAGIVTLVNRVLAKPLDELLGGGTREILSFNISQAFSFDDDAPLQISSDGETSSKEGPLRFNLRYNPSSRLLLESAASYSTLFSNLSSTSLSTSYCGSGAGTCVVRMPSGAIVQSEVGMGNLIGLTWFTRWRAETGDKRSDQVRFFGGFDVVRDKLRFEAYVNYDVEEGEVQQQTYAIHYNPSCYGVRLEMRDTQIEGREETEYALSFSLKNVGSFFGVTTGGSSSR